MASLPEGHKKAIVPRKIIVIGDVRGRFRSTFDKIQSINTKHHFDAAFCVGNFFGDDASELKQYIEGKRKIAIPTYFIVADDGDTQFVDQLPDPAKGGQIVANLHFLGRFGVDTVHGVKVAFLSGIYESTTFNLAPSDFEINWRPHYCNHDIGNMRRIDGDVDVLLTSEWPRFFHLGMLHGVDTSSKVPDGLTLLEFSKLGRSPVVKNLALRTSPQYHFAATEGLHFRLAPYLHHKKPVRFITLGPVGGSAKSIYACNIEASSTLSTGIKCTPCPLSLPFKAVVDESRAQDECDVDADNQLKRVVHKRKLSEMERESRQEISERWQSGKFEGKVHPPPTYVCYKCGVPGHYINECDGGSTPHRGVNRDDYLFEKFGGARHRKRFKKSGDECWFCVGSKNTETHLIISIAEHSYLALAKGPLIAGNHCQIVPIQHLSNSMKFPAAVRREVDRYLVCLEKCYAKEGKSLLILDRNLPSANIVHCFLEVIAVEREQVVGLKKTLFAEARRCGIEFEVHSDGATKYNVGSFGYLILHSTADGEKYVHSVQSGSKRIPLNFLRKVIAIHLNMPERTEWTLSVSSSAEETNQANRLKDRFKMYDWTKAQTDK